MKKTSLVLSILIGLFMVWGGVLHFLKPTFYLPFVPGFLPFRGAFVLLSGSAEILLGIAVLNPGTRRLGGFGILILMFIFLPIHVWDLFRAHPAIGSHHAAWIRLPFQFLFILWAWFVASTAPPTRTHRS